MQNFTRFLLLLLLLAADSATATDTTNTIVSRVCGVCLYTECLTDWLAETEGFSLDGTRNLPMDPVPIWGSSESFTFHQTNLINYHLCLPTVWHLALATLNSTCILLGLYAENLSNHSHLTFSFNDDHLVCEPLDTRGSLRGEARQARKQSLHIKRLLTLFTNRSFLYLCPTTFGDLPFLALLIASRGIPNFPLIGPSNLVELVFLCRQQCVAFRSGKFHAKTLRSNPLDLGVFSWWHSFPRAHTDQRINMLFDENTQYCQHKQRGESKRTSHTYSAIALRAFTNTGSERTLTGVVDVSSTGPWTTVATGNTALL